MDKDSNDALSFDDFDEVINPRPEETDFDRVVEAALSRRGFLGGVLAMGSFAALGGALVPQAARAMTSRFAYDAIATSTADAISVPAGYKADVVVRWGDPLFSDAPRIRSRHAWHRRQPGARLWRQQ